MRKTKYYAIPIESKERGNSHVHSFIWIFNGPNIGNKAAYIEFIEKTKYAPLREHLSDLELFELVKTYQIEQEWQEWNNHEKEWIYRYLIILQTIIAKPLDSKLSNEENQEILTWRNTLLSQVKSYIDNNLCPAKVNVIDPTKDRFTQPLSVKEVLYK